MAVTGSRGSSLVRLRLLQLESCDHTIGLRALSIHRLAGVPTVFHRFAFNATRAETRATVDAPRDHGVRVVSTWEALMTGRFAGTPKRVQAAAYAACLAALLVSACNTSDTQDSNPPSPQPSSTTSTPIPSLSPSETKSETPDQRDARLAGEAVVQYWAVVDDLAAHPTKSLNLLDPVARDQARAQRQIALGTYAARGWVQSGKAAVSNVKATSKDGKTFIVAACVDVSGIDFVDEKGDSQVNPDRPDRQSFSYTVVKADEGFFVTEDTLKGKPC